MQTYLEDIFSQPQSLRDCAGALCRSRIAALEEMCARPWRQIVFAGMGSSNYCAIPAVQHLMRHGRSALRLSAADVFNYGLASIGADTLLVLNSQSGESVEIVRLLEKLSETDNVIAVTNNAESTLGRMAALTLPISAAPEKSVTTRTYLNSIVLDLLIAHALCGRQGEALLEDVKQTADAMEKWMTQSDAMLDQMLRTLGNPAQLCMLGRGCSFATACAGSLFLREVSRCPAFYELCGEFRHGPMEIVDDAFYGVLIASKEETFPLQQRLAKDICAHGGHLIAIACEPIEGVETIVMPQVSDELSPLMTILPIQLYADHMAKHKGIEPGAFRWGSKITTTE